MAKIPYSKEDNYSAAIIQERQQFLKTVSDADLTNITQYAINPQETAGNIENFIGFSNIPLGLAGPLKVNSEHADGKFYTPMATTE